MSLKDEKGVFGWIVLAVFLLMIGVPSVLVSINQHVVSDAEYQTLTFNEQIKVTSESTHVVSFYGGLGFLIAGCASLILAMLIRFK